MSKFIRLNVMYYSTFNNEWYRSEQLINVDSIIRVFKESEKRTEIVTTEIDKDTLKYNDSRFDINNTHHTIDMPYEELSQYILDTTNK